MEQLIDCAIHRISFLGTEEKLILQGMNLGEDDFIRLDSYGLQCLGLGSRRRGRSYDPAGTLAAARSDLKWLNGPGRDILPVWHSGYPWLLRQLYNPPFLLFLRSNGPSAPEVFHKSAISVVGTRKPSAPGEIWAYQISADLSAMDVVIVSGLARGIDSMAHRGALSAGGLTVAVLGHGPDIIYPSANARLASDIVAAGGCLISEYPPGTPPRNFRFPERNRIISGLAAGVLMVEAPEKSGALITVDFALEQGREVVLLAQLQDSRRNDGGRVLADCGAPLADNAGEILKLLSPDLLFRDGECRN